MTRTCHLLLLLTALLFAASIEYARAATAIESPVAQALEMFEGAEDRFVAPDPLWFEGTRAALLKESESVDLELESHGSDYAAAWKNHLRWPLLTSNLGEVQDVDVDELALVRRWLFSNRKGLEYPFFALLRDRTEAHLDAAYTLSHANLDDVFRQQVRTVRSQIRQLAVDPSDANAAALGRTLGWLERTRQLEEETASVRSLLSHPNAQIVVAKPLIDRVIALFATAVEQTLPVSDRVTVPNASLLGRSKTIDVHGVASTHGQIVVELAENADFADLQLVYRGEIDSRCRAAVGPVKIAMQTLGPVQAVTPVQLSLQGVQLITTKVEPEVRTRVTNISAKNELFRRIGKRRVESPESHQQMNSRASQKATSLLQKEMDQRVEKAIEEIRAELQAAQSSFNGFSEVLAPVVREGASPRWEGMRSMTDSIIVNGMSQRREQFGAPTAPPSCKPADVQFRLHVSFFNNMAETIMAGKTFTDEYFMRYGRILQAELPPQLMVHSRSVRWAIIAEKPRPLEITIPSTNHFRIRLRMQRVDIGDEQFTGPTIATIHYDLIENEYGEYQLERQGNIELDSSLPDEQRDFLLQKLSAFFAPVLDAGGVALPEGGSLGRLRGLEPQGTHAESDWLTLGINVPTEVLKAWLPLAN